MLSVSVLFDFWAKNEYFSLRYEEYDQHIKF